MGAETGQVNVLPLHHGATSRPPGYSAWLAPSYLRPVRLVLDERVEVDGTGEDARRYSSQRAFSNSAETLIEPPVTFSLRSQFL